MCASWLYIVIIITFRVEVLGNYYILISSSILFLHNSFIIKIIILFYIFPTIKDNAINYYFQLQNVKNGSTRN